MTDCRKQLLLYAVTDRSWLKGKTLAESVAEAIEGGVTMVQFREKELKGSELESEALAVRKVCRAHNIPFLVNDNVELALKLDADGVHLGQDDMDPYTARRLLGPDKIIGVTAKTPAQAKAAQEKGADYLGSGAVFGTDTKKDAKPMDAAVLKAVCAGADIPVCAIGGINAGNIERLKGSGVSGFAIVSGIFAADDIKQECRKLLNKARRIVHPSYCPNDTVQEYLDTVADKRPVVHCITNIVTVNDCANALLAAGASPTMAHHPMEAGEFAAYADALVLNMGATESLEAMLIAGTKARQLDKPVVIDPVGCAGSAWRRKQCLDLIGSVTPSCIRGNGAEILALAGDLNTGQGVDDKYDEDRPGLAEAAAILSERTGAVVIASGETDIIAGEGLIRKVERGSAMMRRITGSGCMLSALLGAFLAAENSPESAYACCTWMALCGEEAERRTISESGGTGTFHLRLIDAMSLMSGARPV